MGGGGGAPSGHSAAALARPASWRGASWDWRREGRAWKPGAGEAAGGAARRGGA